MFDPCFNSFDFAAQIKRRAGCECLNESQSKNIGYTLKGRHWNKGIPWVTTIFTDLELRIPICIFFCQNGDLLCYTDAEASLKK